MTDPRTSLPLKITACFLTVLLTITAAASFLGMVMLNSYGYNDKVYKDTSIFSQIAFQTARSYLTNLQEGQPTDDYASDTGLVCSVISNGAEKTTVHSTGQIPANYEAIYRISVSIAPDELTSSSILSPGDYAVTLYVTDFSAQNSPFYDSYQTYSFLSPWDPYLLPIGICSTLLGLICLVYLLCAAGHRKEETGLTANVQDRIPLDLYLAGMILLGTFLCWILSSSGLLYDPIFVVFSQPTLFFVLLLLSALLALVLAALLTLATRLKMGRFWANTLIYRILRLIFRGIARIFRTIRDLFRALPSTWRIALFVGGFLLLDIFLIIGTFNSYNNQGILFLLTLVLNFCGWGAAVFAASQFQVLRKEGKDLAEGKLDQKVNTANMFWAFKEHAQHLNAIGEGMNRAVEQRMKSERLKTELITNVSHDIKTPLTSIVNYVDLLGKEELTETAADYVAVLDRQSRRLKKLTEDLVEASKASTGNIKVQLQPIVINEIINQALGDYDQRLTDGRLEVIVNTYQGSVSALADGRLLWRVLDNLLSNVCKYAMAGSRVYIDLSEKDGVARLSMKNISRDPLNISADELMERFVRGDSSRHTEGSGLGLNIAKSLMDLMGGTFTLNVDGDLFKAELTLKGA